MPRLATPREIGETVAFLASEDAAYVTAPGGLSELRDGHLTVALVTGAAGGIGRATADLLEERGYRVARNDLPGQRVAGYAAPADVADSAAVDAMVARVRQELGPVEVLVANAAAMTMGRIEDVSEADFWRILDVNLAGVFHCARACVPAHARGRPRPDRGHLVGVGADRLAPGHGLLGLEGRDHLDGQGLRPRSSARRASPRTSWRRGRSTPSSSRVDADDAGETLDELRRRYAAEAPLGRLGTPRDVAGAVAFLASEHAGSLTGQVLAPNGGTTR